ncbi:MAG: GrpB family protein [Faecalibacillus faecis]
MKKKPSTYAHYRFGQEVLKELPNDIKKIIIENKELCDIGLHGPDLLFYYLPLKTNEINSIGYNMHEKTGKEVFDTFRKMMTSKKQINHYLAYYYGFICHFALDATCHGYIEKRIHESGVSHGEIEVEFDRFLMIEDPQDSKELKRHLAFRNYLRKHPNTVKEYGKIKKEAAKLYPNDIEKYCMYKSQIIEKIYKEIGL